MDKLLKKSLAFLLALVMVLSVLPVFEVSAATVNYETGSSEKYGNVTKNWGERGELATFLSPKAEDFYATQSFSYDTYVNMSGSSNTSTVPSSELYTALYELMADAHTTITDYDDIREVFQYTDCENNGNTSSMISGFYSGTALTPAWDGGLTWNREHTWPQSKSASGDDKEDIMSIRAESSSVNSSRGNKAYGESSSYYDPNDESDGEYNLHGDVARVILYTYVRWGGETKKIDGSTLQSNMWGTDGVIESVDILLQWMEEDPVDTWEMGRNDSVESITGTRNVFVDYPELAFVLFNEEIPEMDTPSGNADSISYTITAQTNNATYGTVSVNNSYITAHPAEGYKATGYQVISGNATVTPNGNIFTISATGNCTIRINFAAKEQYTATFMEDGETVSSQKAYEEYCVTMPAYSGETPDGYTFRGWVDSVVYNTAEKPANVYAAGDEHTLDGDTTFYALMSYVNENDTSGGDLTYKLVTSESQLSEGASVVIAAADYDYALGTTQKTNNRNAVAIVKGTDTLVFDSDDGVQVLTLVTGTVDGTYGLSTGSGYLYAASSGENQLKTKTTLDDKGSFKITVNSDGSCAVNASDSSVRNRLLYNTSMLFSCYSTSSNMKAIALYVGVRGGTTYYTMAWNYVPTDPEETEPETTEPETTEPTTTEPVTTEPTTTEPVGETTTLTYVISEYDAGEQYADNEAHKLDDYVTVVTNDAHFTEQLRLYDSSAHDGTAVIQTAQVIDSLALNIGYKSGTLSVYGSTDGENWTSITDITAVSAYKDYTVDMPEGAAYNYVKLDSTGDTQLRIKSFSVTFVAECDHQYEEFGVIAATCTQPGSITYSCTECGDTYTEQTDALGHSYGDWVTVVAPTYKQTGTKTCTCSVCGDVQTEEIPVLNNPVTGWYISLRDNIGVNFEMSLADTDVVTVNGATVTAVNGTVSVELAAAQMCDEIVITVNGLPLEKTYSVKGYADTILADSSKSDCHDLVKAMLVYGGASQIVFEHNTGNLANNEISDAPVYDLEAAKEIALSDNISGIDFYGASLSYRNKIAVRFYFTASLEGYTISAGDYAVTTGEKNGLYYVEVAGILPQDLGEQIELTVAETADSVISVSYGPMNYIERMSIKGTEPVQALVNALYNYYKAAAAYTA